MMHECMPAWPAHEEVSRKEDLRSEKANGDLTRGVKSVDDDRRKTKSDSLSEQERGTSMQMWCLTRIASRQRSESSLDHECTHTKKCEARCKAAAGEVKTVKK